MSRFNKRSQRQQAQNGNSATATKGEPPEHVVRLGMIKAAVWLNHSGEGDDERTYRTVTLSRSFQQDGEWTEQKITLYPTDIPIIGQVLQEALRHIFGVQTNDGEEVPY